MSLQSWTHGFDEIRFQMGAENFSHESLEGLLNHVPLAIAATFGADHRYVFANRLYHSAFAEESGTLLGKTIAHLMSYGNSPTIQASFHHVFSSGEAHEMMDVPYSQGSQERFWDIKLLPIRNAENHVGGVLALAADVTERVCARNESKQHAWAAAMDSERFKLAVEATDLGFWDWTARTKQTYWSARQRDIFGIPRDEPITNELWVSRIHPDDRERVLNKLAMVEKPESKGQFHLEYRIVKPDGDIRCISSVGRMLYEMVDGELKPSRQLGTILDITEKYKNEEIRQLLIQELNHRVKNLFAMASSIVTLTARTATTPEQMATAIRGRLDALAQAHELIRPAVTGDQPTESVTSVEAIIRTILSPHCDQDAEERTAIVGPSVPVGAETATSLTLVLHELATNASKYGALSVFNGHLRIAWECVDRSLVLSWRERDGPTIAQEPCSRGFGSKLVFTTIKDQLGGDISYDWNQNGLSVSMVIPLDRLSYRSISGKG